MHSESAPDDTAAQVRWPLFLRFGVAAAATGLMGVAVWSLGAGFVDHTTNAKLHDTMPMIGSSMMSVSSLLFMVTAAMAIVHSLRTRSFTLVHVVALIISACATLAAGIDGAYPR